MLDPIPVYLYTGTVPVCFISTMKDDPRYTILGLDQVASGNMPHDDLFDVLDVQAKFSDRQHQVFEALVLFGGEQHA